MRFRDVKKYLNERGYSVLRRCDGSHTIFVNSDGHKVMVGEHHKGEYPRQYFEKLKKEIAK